MLMHDTHHHFKVTVTTFHDSDWQIDFSISSSFALTNQLTTLKADIARQLPQILHAECDNPRGLPFSEEIYDTETAHFFEHVLLEFLCALQLKEGAAEACYEGRTFWDAQADVCTDYKIRINKQGESRQTFMKAVALSSRLLTRVIENSINDVSFHAKRGGNPLLVALAAM